MIIEMVLSGFLFLFILATFLASVAFGNKFGFDFEPDDMLTKINKNPNKFKKSIVLLLMSSGSVIVLAMRARSGN